MIDGCDRYIKQHQERTHPVSTVRLTLLPFVAVDTGKGPSTFYGVSIYSGVVNICLL